MDFKRRLMLFLFGVILGTFFVYAVLFRNRELPAWTPNGRVIQALKSAPVKMDSKTRCLLECHGIEDEDVILIINDGKVLFNESSIRDKEIPEYVVRGKGSDGKFLKIKFRSVPNFTEIMNVEDGRKGIIQCDC
jgi:hypothetical protein